MPQKTPFNAHSYKVYNIIIIITIRTATPGIVTTTVIRIYYEYHNSYSYVFFFVSSISIFISYFCFVSLSRVPGVESKYRRASIE